jgi:hypothetical protein
MFGAFTYTHTYPSHAALTLNIPENLYFVADRDVKITGVRGAKLSGVS